MKSVCSFRTVWFVTVVILLLWHPMRAHAQKNPPFGTFAFAESLIVPGSPEEIYDAITGDISPWWDHSFSEKPYRLFIEPKPGGGFYEIFNEKGEGVLHATVIFARRGEMLRFEGPLGLSGRAVTLVCTYALRPAGADSTRLELAVRCSGEVEEGLSGVVQNVWRHFLFERFKPYIESGEFRKRRP
jgi:hypothetical protein